MGYEITDPADVAEEKSIRVEVKSHSREGLLVGFLNELVFQFDTYGFIGKRVEVNALEEQRIDATVTGEDFDSARHESNLLIKAATYHGVKVEKEDGDWVVECIFDI
jgi:SHS2 domain-containing protein